MQKGYSFLELTIVLALASLVLLMLSELLGKSHQSFTEQEERAIREENIRQAFSVLREELNNARYLGCVPPNKAKHLVNHLPPSLNFDYDKLLVVQQGLNNAPDVLEVRSALETSSADLTVPVNEMRSIFWVDIFSSGSLIIKPFDVVVISNCEQAEIFLAERRHGVHNAIYYAQIPAPHEDSISREYRGIQNRSTHLSNTWDPEIVPKIYKMHSARYSIKDKGLFQDDQELISGVTNFQIYSGVDKDCDGNIEEYTDLPTPDFSKVMAIRFRLTFQGEGLLPVTLTDTVRLRNGECGM